MVKKPPPCPSVCMLNCLPLSESPFGATAGAYASFQRTSCLGGSISGRLTFLSSAARTAWDGIHQPIPISSVTEAKGKTVIQSLCDAPDTRHYCAVVGKNDISPFGAIANPASPFQCYKWAVEYGSYFFLFKPLRMIAAEGRIENEIVHPLIIERGGVLKEKDWVELRRLAKEFNYVLNINR